MKVFLDTNVVIASFISHGICHELFEYCIKEHHLILSEQVIRELSENLLKKFKYPKPQVLEIINFLQDTLEIIPSPPPLVSPVCRDRDDDGILSAAFYSHSHCLISGDEDLLILKNYKSIPILKPSEFWKFEEQYKY